MCVGVSLIAMDLFYVVFAVLILVALKRLAKDQPTFIIFMSSCLADILMYTQNFIMAFALVGRKFFHIMDFLPVWVPNCRVREQCTLVTEEIRRTTKETYCFFAWARARGDTQQELV